LLNNISISERTRYLKKCIHQNKKPLNKHGPSSVMDLSLESSLKIKEKRILTKNLKIDRVVH
jgi:hypothetical protein